MEHELASAAETYERIAPIYDFLDGPYEVFWKRRLRQSVFNGLSGRVLDAGVGTGCNFVAYPTNAVVTGIDISHSMLLRARKRAARMELDIELARMDLCALDLPDRIFDAIAATFVFACIPDDRQQPALSELRRVCHPAGEMRLLDYRLSEEPVRRAAMQMKAPWLKWAFSATYTPGTNKYIEAAGWRVIEERPLIRDHVLMTRLKPM